MYLHWLWEDSVGSDGQYNLDFSLSWDLKKYQDTGEYHDTIQLKGINEQNIHADRNSISVKCEHPV